MKVFKYLLAGFLLISMTSPAFSQDNDATIKSITIKIKADAKASLDEVKEVVKKNKKFADVLVGIGRAYLDIKDTVNAKKYADMAYKVNRKYGPTYILLGDIEVLKDNGGEASAWYEQAIYFDPKNPEPYRKYAQINSKVSPSSSVAKLEELRQQRPDIEVDAIAARIYYNSGNYDKCLEYYNKCNVAKLEDTDITNYAMTLWLTHQREKSLSVALEGLQRNPRKAAWNRLAFYNLTDMNRNNEAVDYGNRLFTASDSAKISGYDYTYYGQALLGDKQYDKAIEMFEQAMKANEGNNELVNSNRKSLADAYAAKDDFASAIKYYDEYLSKVEKPTATDIAGLGTIYQQQAASLTGNAQKEAFLKADKVYERLGNMFPANIDFANFMRARINANLDPDTKDGLAKPYYEALANSLGNKSDRDNVDNSRLMEAYRYLAYYYYLNDNKAAYEPLCRKMLEIDPDNDVAKQLLGIR